MPLGDGIRRDVSKVSQSERDRLRDAIIALHTRKYPDGVSHWFKQDEIHDSTHVHNCPAFIPWHRELVNRFEALLREVDADLSLHYWDWTTDPHPLFTPTFMGTASGSAGAPWLAAGFYVPGAAPNRDASGIPADPPLNIIRSVGAGAPVTPAQDSAVLGATDFPDLNTKLTASHNQAHGFN